MENKLKPCPFCKEKENLSVNKDNSLVKNKFVQCFECYATGPRAKTDEEAIYLWNKRNKKFEVYL